MKKYFILLICLVPLTGCQEQEQFVNAYQDKARTSTVSSVESGVFKLCEYDENAYAYSSFTNESPLTEPGYYLIKEPTVKIIKDIQSAYPKGKVLYNKDKEVMLYIPE